MADSQLGRYDPRSQSTFPTQTKDTVTHRDRELEREAAPCRMHVETKGDLHLDPDLDSEILRESSREGREMCGRTEKYTKRS